jgi:MFS family permease
MRANSIPLESTGDALHAEVPAIGVGGWIVLASAFVGWMFDAMDLHLFTMIMLPSLRELLGLSANNLAQIGGLIVGAKLLGWGFGGIVFGVLADRMGRARVMLATIVIYSIFTAASALAQNWHQLLVLQMISGLGIGGEWAAGAALVVETWPGRHRAKAVQVMQAAMVVGLIIASTLAIVMSSLGWRWILAVGAAPAVVSLGLRLVTPESARWKQSHEAAIHHQGPKMGSLSEIFGRPLRRRTLVGSMIAAAMMIGSWGGAILFPVLIQSISPGLSAAELTRQTGIAFMAMNAGAVLGFASTLALVWRLPRLSRRAVYAGYCAGAWIATIFLYTAGNTVTLFRLAMFGFGYFAIGGFGIVALYLTELFPVHVRATGQGFTWNVARLFTAIGPLAISAASSTFGIHAVGVAIATAFGVGLAAVGFGPETSRKSGAEGYQEL